MKKDARTKRSKHTKKIAACERKFPVYGLNDINNPSTLDRLQKMGMISEEQIAKGSKDKV